MKYIDADKLKAEIERRIGVLEKNIKNGYNAQVEAVIECKGILSFIESLTQSNK